MATALSYGHEATAAGSLSVREVSLASATEAEREIWRHRNAEFGQDTIYTSPTWIGGFHRYDPALVSLFFFEQGPEIIGVAPFVVNRHPLKCQLGEITVARLPLRRRQALADVPNAPATHQVYDALFAALVRSGTADDVIVLDHVPTNAPLFQYLHDSPLVDRYFHLYSTGQPRPRPVIRIVGDFEQYLSKFTAKTRANRRREVKRFLDIPGARVAAINTTELVDAHISAIASVSEKTYQYHLLGLGVRDIPEQARRMRWAAEHGWLRSYLLLAGESPVAFMIGYQYAGRFIYANVGYDPAWRHWGVGNVLQFLALEDIFRHRRPAIFDFGGPGPQKEYWGASLYTEAEVFLFRRRFYPRAANLTWHTFTETSRAVRGLLDRAGLSATIKRSLRHLFSRTHVAAKPTR